MTLNRDAMIEASNVGIFTILTAMTQGDRSTLLDAINIVRNHNQSYRYLEVGSDKGGSIIAPVQDSRCSAVLSIDLRPASQPDERGVDFDFPDNSADRMRQHLVDAGVPRGSMLKLQTFDADVADVTLEDIGGKCDLAFIDAEHTNQAVFRDFLKVRRLLKPDAILLFHDSQLIFDGLINVEELLKDEGWDFSAFYMPTTIYGVAFGNLINPFKQAFQNTSYEKNVYIKQSRENLRVAISGFRTRKSASDQ